MTFDDVAHDARRREAAETLGMTLRAWRRARGLSQGEVARKAGLSLPSYGGLERGRTPAGGVANPTLDTLLRIFAALDVPAPELPQLIAAADRRR